jgi:glyoxylase-like metal-dependent hydrolase (beta-lactamase superfamily II)
MLAFAKKFALVLLGLVCVGIVVLAVTLLPAHLQVRSVETVIPALGLLDEALDAIPAERYPREIHFINTATQAGALGEISHIAVLLRWSDGNAFLIDTGMNEQEAVDFGKPFQYLGASATEAFGPVEEQLGDAVDSIRGIGFTHLHSDHTAGISRICSALTTPATVFKTSAQNTLHNLHTEEGQKLINDSACPVALLPQSTPAAIPGFPGLLVLPAGGHTPGSTIFATRMGGETWIFAGDIANSMADIHDNRSKGVLYSYLLVPEHTKVLENWRIWLAQQTAQQYVQVLVTHDIDAYRSSGLAELRAP